MRTTPSLTLATLTLLGCGSPATTPQPVQEHVVHSPPLERLPTPPISPLEVHEWGLIDVYSDGQIELAAGPGTAASRPAPHPSRPPSRPMPMRKPVVYFHLDESVPSLDVHVEVHIAGRMIETWPTPTTQTGVDHIGWQASLTQCPAGAHSAASDSAVQAARANCQTSDHVCEVADLPTYETSDGACVNVGAQHGRFLFYRGELAQGTAFPLSIQGTDLRINAALPQNLYVIREDQGAMVHPALGTLALPSLSGSSTALIEPFTNDLQAAGLTQNEARAFMAAWSDELFGSSTTRDDRAATAPESILVYFLPRADIERLAPMTVTPTPRSLERVMVVRQHLAI